MRAFERWVIAGHLCVLAGASAMAQGAAPGKPVAAVQKTHAGFYVDPATLAIVPLLPAPPLQDSAAVASELAELHRIEHSRTPAQVAAAVADDQEEDIFSYRTDG
jgi:hypothetical protein